MKKKPKFKDSIDIYHVIAKVSIWDKLKYGTKVSHYLLTTFTTLSDHKGIMYKTYIKNPKEDLPIKKNEGALLLEEIMRVRGITSKRSVEHELTKIKVNTSIKYV